MIVIVSVGFGPFAHSQRGAPSHRGTLHRTTFTNPIVREAADPWIVFRRGWYYFTCTSGRSVTIRKARRLSELQSVPVVTVWHAHAAGPESQNVWAPELHYLQGRWFVYFAADDGKNANHRIYVLESVTQDPQGAYRERGKIHERSDRWAIDATVLQSHGKLYLVWSGWEAGPGPQNLYIAPMKNPWSLAGPRVRISTPDFSWERRGWAVNEGPEELHHGRRTFIVYSGSGGSKPDYCLGLLECRGEPLISSSWRKSSAPIFTTYVSKEGSVFGPGHCGFFRSPDNTEDWIVYHGRETVRESWSGRHARAQPVHWDRRGLPVLGHPIPAGVPIPSPSGEPEEGMRVKSSSSNELHSFGSHHAGA